VPAFRDPPRQAAWRHREARKGFEVVFCGSVEGGHRFEGATAAVEDDEAWTVAYSIELGPDWVTRTARLSARSAGGVRELTIEHDGRGGWHANGTPLQCLDGCLDLDLESSALTNAFPVHRLGLEIGEEAEAPAAYVRAIDLSVERVEQRYARIEDDRERQRYRYESPGFGFECELSYDGSGLVLDYPGIATRAA
jgi:hypothetical protein